MPTVSVTISEILTQAETRLSEAALPNPKLEAQLLLCDVVGVPRFELMALSRRSLSERQLAQFESHLTRRTNYEPVQYIMGTAPFRHLDLVVGPGVLIPRPETEILVDHALSGLRQNACVCDVCTGSGAVALAIATERPDSRVYGTELSADALAFACKNQDLVCASNCTFVRASLLECFPATPCFDLIVSNPPYVTTSEMDDLPREVSHFEPHLALEAGCSGLDAYEKLIPQASQKLKSGGKLAMEIGETQRTEVLALVEETGRFTSLHCHQDLAGRDRVITCMAK